MWYWHGIGPWGWLMMVLFWAAVIFLIVRGVWASDDPVRPAEDRAVRTLDERFARGEIDGAEYKERRQLIESHR